ncbi:MAG: hypothetical protein VKM01_01780 [Cyanobacteriota bacterium]|nr:hypothetical protein [Cyanobacteriota bacterium]
MVDTHLHLRPFAGPPIPLPDLPQMVRRSGVPLTPSLRNDIVNAQGLACSAGWGR